MKILFISSRIPYPPDRGDKVRVLFILTSLAALGKITLVCLVQPKTDSASMAYLKRIIPEVHYVPHSTLRSAINLLRNIFKATPFQVAYYRNPKLYKLLAKLNSANDYDVVYTHLIRMAPYSQSITNKHVIMDYTDCISLEYQRSLAHRKGIMKMFFTEEAKRTQIYEQYLKDKFEENWIISQVDLAALKLENDPHSIIMPNMVKIPDNTVNHPLNNRLVLCGNMSVAHNVTAALAVSQVIMPMLIPKFPKLQFYIIGASPCKAILALHGKNNTVVTGFVPNLYKELQESDIFVAPLYFSAGIQNKALEAMACRLPVVTTPNVAASLGCSDGNELVCAIDNAVFAIKIEELLLDGKLRNRIGENGFQYVCKHFSAEAVTTLINNQINKLITR